MITQRELLDGLATLTESELAEVKAGLTPEERAFMEALLNPPQRYVAPPKLPFRELVSVRTKAGMAAKRQRNLRISRYPPIGRRFVRAYKRTFAVADRDQLRFVPMIVEWREQDGLGWQAMSDRIETILAAEQGRRPYTEITTPRRLWDRERCRRVYLRREALLAEWQGVLDLDAEIAAHEAEAHAGAGGSM